MEDMNKKAPAKEKQSVFSRIGHFFRSYKSESKKIVWCPWKQVRKNSLVVLVIVVACAAIICALDFGFSWGLKELRGVVNPSDVAPEIVVDTTTDTTGTTEETTEDAADDAATEETTEGEATGEADAE